MTPMILATAVLEVLEPDRLYEAADLHARFPDNSMDTLRDAMHALWLERRVERVGALGWRRQESKIRGAFVAEDRESAQAG